MLTRHQQGAVTWIDMLSPSAEEVHELLQECDIPPDFLNDLTTMSPRTEVLASPHALKLVLDYPIVKRTDISHPHEIKFIATKTHLITVRFEDIEAIHRYSKEFEIRSVLTKKKGKTTGGHLLISLLDHLYEALNKKLDYLDARVTEIESGIFEERERAMVIEISHLTRRLINFTQAIRAHEPALVDLETQIKTTFSSSYQSSAHHLLECQRHLERRTQTLTTTVTELRNTNTALLSTKQNEIMKNLTIVAFVTFPLTLIASLFSMSTQDTPLVGTPGDWWIIVSAMAIGSIGLFVYFYFKRWL